VRITPEELKVKLDGEEDVLVVDRSRATGTLSSTAPAQQGLQQMD
jgi:hypothetical protein